LKNYESVKQGKFMLFMHKLLKNHKGYREGSKISVWMVQEEWGKSLVYFLTLQANG